MALRSATHRETIARQLTLLRRTRPTLPFFKLACHRQPTLWSLYRRLLQESHDPYLTRWFRESFREQKALTSPTATATELKKWHRLLDYMVNAKDNNAHCRTVVARYAQMIKARLQRKDLQNIVVEEYRSSLHPPVPIMLTGGHLKPTKFNRPLPRLKPQPLHISMMIRKRRIGRDRRLGVQRLWRGWLADVGHERQFESFLSRFKPSTDRFKPVFSRTTSWRHPIQLLIRKTRLSLKRDVDRSGKLYTRDMIEKIKDARRRKITNKTRERLLARRGFYTKTILKRMRQGPPAHILARMSAKDRFLDRISRRPGESGYTRQVKLQKGHQLKESFSRNTRRTRIS